jgi:hypothetical protein
MIQYVLLDDDNICRCKATNEKNLHQEKIDAGMKKFPVQGIFRIGDKLTLDKSFFKKVKTKRAKHDPETEELIAPAEFKDIFSHYSVIVEQKPENYPQPNEAELWERKVKDEMRKIAEERLISKGEVKP